MITILHLSDIHFGHKTEPTPVERVIAGVRGLVIESEILLVIVSGDIAYSGDEKEYSLAKAYLDELKEGIEKDKDCPVCVVLSPGNHDCNFPEDSELREAAINRIVEGTGDHLSDSLRDECLRVQHNFFSFEESISGVNHRGLAWLHQCDLKNGDKLVCRVLNSAWMSKLVEEQGSLLFPIQEIPNTGSPSILISVIHHPYNWFESNNARELKRTLEDDSNIIITGHEHDINHYEKTKDNINRTGYVEGGVFSGNASVQSSFNIVNIDTKEKKYSVQELAWNGSSYTCISSDVFWNDYISSDVTAKVELMLSQDTIEYLADPGLKLTHRHKTPEFDDIFVPPELKIYSFSTKEDAYTSSRIRSDETINALIADKYAYILADAQCGKTMLAKALYKHAIRREFYPCMILDGSKITSHTGALKILIDNSVKEQYRKMSTEEYWQIPKADRIILLDDFAEANLNNDGKKEITDWLRKNFGYVYLFGSDVTQIEEMLVSASIENVIDGFKRYEVTPFGYEARDKLVEKWLLLGRKYQIGMEDLNHELRVVTRKIDAILAGNLVQPTPLHVLMILQQLEAYTPHDTPKTGSYGYIYEAFLTYSINKTADSAEDIDTKYTYLSELAWHNYNNGIEKLDEESLVDFTYKHVEDYELKKSPEVLLEEIQGTGIIRELFGVYRFAYKYIEYYFIAKYIKENIHDNECENILAKATNELFREDYANILIFYTYLSKDKAVIDAIIETASGLFNDVTPCDMEEHTKFVGKLQDSIPEILLPDIDPSEARHELLVNKDKNNQNIKQENDSEIKSSLEEEYSDNILLNVNSAIKALQVLGQILRNFSGSLKGDMKQRIAKECISLAYRVLNGFYIALGIALDSLLMELAELFGKNLEEVPEERREEAARRFVFLLTVTMCHATLQRISNSVGSEELLKTFLKLEKNWNTRATRFAQLAIRLNHYKRFPKTQIIALFEEVKDDVFCSTILRMIVAEHFYLFNRPRITRQEVCDRLGIKYGAFNKGYLLKEIAKT